MQQKNKEEAKQLAYLIHEYSLHQHFDLLKLSVSLFEHSNFDSINKLLGKKSKAENNE